MSNDVAAELAAASVRGVLEIRSAEVVDVRFPDRVVEVVAMPYGQPAVVVHEGRAVTEVCEPGAFDGVEKRANRIRVNRDHDLAKTVGRAMALHPSRTEGLVAELRISKTSLGEETLELAADGALDASVGFAPFPGGERWSRDRRQRSLVKCWLGHIALVPEPAYDGAQVLAVRNGISYATSSDVALATTAPPSSTPILDRLLAERAAKSYRLQLPTEL